MREVLVRIISKISYYCIRVLRFKHYLYQLWFWYNDKDLSLQSRFYKLKFYYLLKKKTEKWIVKKVDKTYETEKMKGNIV